MSSFAIILVLMSAGIHIIWNSLTKSSTNPRSFSLFKGTILTIVAIIVSLSFPVLTIPIGIWTFILLSGVVHSVYILALSTAYEKGEISYVYPIVRSAPAFIPLAAFIMLGETISIRGGAGIFIVVSCIVILLLQGKLLTNASLTSTFFRKDNFWAFITLGTVVIYSITDKSGMLAMQQVDELPSYMHSVIFFLLETTVCYLIYWAYMVSSNKGIQWSIWKHEWWKISIAAFGTMLSYALILHVMKTENLSYIVTLRQSSILFAVIVGWFWFREPFIKIRLLIAIVMIFGLYLVATG